MASRDRRTNSDQIGPNTRVEGAQSDEAPSNNDESRPSPPATPASAHINDVSQSEVVYNVQPGDQANITLDTISVARVQLERSFKISGGAAAPTAPILASPMLDTQPPQPQWSENEMDDRVLCLCMGGLIFIFFVIIYVYLQFYPD
ncbi:uncharacterized protein LOC111693408 [Trichogramma pretiosum]|uniref:uncharacterized protein LOC111693408 n=1 Tax=Trichogramma pretiosum TaxID=7493 RepID=UPI000C71A24D|nr:uncharacterized protein LOC111693408 [Trichogramma pretiosum]